MYRVILGATALLVAGCSSQASLLVASQPPGAYITEAGTGTAIGIAPVYVVYPTAGLRRYPDGRGCFRAAGLEARWVSGAQATVDTVRICGNAKGHYQIVLTRDPSLPDLDKDLQFAMQVEAARAQQQQAQATSDATLIAAYTAIQQAIPKR